MSEFETPSSIWAGDMGDYHSSPFVVVLNSEYLHIDFTFRTEAERDAIVCRLKQFKSPCTALGMDAHKIGLSSIKELRFSSALDLLEIYHGPSNRRFGIQSKKDPIHEWVYKALRDRLAPGVVPMLGTVSRMGALFVPLCGLVVSLISSALTIHWAIDATAGKNDGLWGMSRIFVYFICHFFGVTGVAASMTVINLCLIGWIIYRWQHLPSAEVIIIPGPEPESPRPLQEHNE